MLTELLVEILCSSSAKPEASKTLATSALNGTILDLTLASFLILSQFLFLPLTSFMGQVMFYQMTLFSNN
jgi:hypothetical protein